MRYENFREIDIDALNVEAKRAAAKHGAQLDVPMGTGPKELFTTDQGMYPEMGDCTYETMASAAKEDTDQAAKDGELTWALILLEEVFEALAESDGIPDDEKLENELLQVAATALRMREIARHRRVIAELQRREKETIEKYGVFPNCHHRNYGTREHPASVYQDCIDCREYYCESCNYDRHQCGGCGEPYRHGENPHPGVSCVDDDPIISAEEPTA